MSRSLPCCSLLLISFMIFGSAVAGVFDLEEVQVSPSPQETRFLEFKNTEKVLDFDVARTGPRAAILVKTQAGGCKVVFWDIGASRVAGEWNVPGEFGFRALAWHPLGTGLFLSGTRGAECVIARVDERGESRDLQVIYKSRQEIRRLVPGPRPYAVEFDPGTDEYRKAYRVFFGLKSPDGAWSIRSVTEKGARDYQVIGRKKWFTTFRDAEEQPSSLEAPSALPAAFHPAGHILLWEDGNRCFHQAQYGRDHWESMAKLDVCGGTVTATPNGMALIHWKQGVPGVAVVGDHGRKRDVQAAAFTFTSTPSSVADGKGIVGQIKKDGRETLAYVPIQVPLADVANAWMFAQASGDEALLTTKGGLLRDLPDDQLYSVYESEAYQCGAYDPSTPTRPYFVTTDVFWELLAAAYEGLFIIGERQQAIPAFRAFVEEAERFYTQAMPDSPWTAVFSTVAALNRGSRETESRGSRPERAAELELMRRATGTEVSPLLGKPLAYWDLKPRGHYASDEAMRNYFTAFKYLTKVAFDNLPVDDLRAMNPEAKSLGLAWIGAYEAFIPRSRSALLLRDDQLAVPPYTRHPFDTSRLFPLAWGFDNEVLLSTVYHGDWPESEQIKGPGGKRLVPSGLDVAAALGSGFADALLAGDRNRFPSLAKALDDLRARRPAGKAGAEAPGNLYDRWIDALAVQWADGVAPPDGARDRDLWNAKRLQTGLASWATLRHATVLVNERTSAECGEGAFEPILLTPPRGYVEPDPATFRSIADVFRSMEQMVGAWKISPGAQIQVEEGDAREALKEGIVRRLSETAAKAELFAKMAEKEIAREPLTGGDYEEILYVGRIAEHHFLVFKSLADKEFALSNPDPMPKIADVAGGENGVPLLMAGVGRPMEWNHIVPYFGRREIVKGSVYSYYEFTSETPMTDREWLEALPGRHHPDWVSPFVSGSEPACPPGNPF
ncbi:MAG: DUF3160 domain-containing protein [Syntrophobacteraceae bacterium]|nr:DUF3160 domain-containing protein [Desulfobacteraceae bacterium]